MFSFQSILPLSGMPASSFARRELDSQRNPGALVVFKQLVLASSPDTLCSCICSFEVAKHRLTRLPLPLLPPSLPPLSFLPSFLLILSPPVSGWGVGKEGRKESMGEKKWFSLGPSELLAENSVMKEINNKNQQKFINMDLMYPQEITGKMRNSKR